MEGGSEEDKARRKVSRGRKEAGRKRIRTQVENSRPGEDKEERNGERQERKAVAENEEREEEGGGRRERGI